MSKPFSSNFSASHSSSNVLKQDSAYSTYVLGLLLAAYVLSFIDRNIMSVLVGPIKAEFQITDFQFGLLQGLFFSIFYTFLGLPIGRLADRYSRRWIITIGVAFWSVMTCLCGFAKSFYLLAFARMGVGLGEAALSPPAHSLLSDYFSPKRLPMAMAVFTLGITLGGGMAYMIGAWVYSAADEGLFKNWPVLSALSPWQMTFVLLGLPGLVLALLMLTIKEPARTGLQTLSSDSAHPSPEFLSISAVLTYFWSKKRLYLSLCLAISLLSILGYGYMSWFIEFMMRRFDIPRKEIGMSFGWMFIVFGSLGALAGGFLSSWLNKKGYLDANMRLVMLVALAWLIPAVFGPQSMQESLAFWAAAPCLFLLNSYFGVSIAALQLVTPNQMRAQASAILLFMTNLLGFGLGPVLIGFFSDHLFFQYDSASLGYSLSLLGAVCCPLAAVLVWYGLPAYRAELTYQNDTDTNNQNDSNAS